MNGFQLTGLRLLSRTAPPAELRFTSGLNVVSGPSDTGKSFALECIDYMLGAGDPLRPITEAIPYDTVQLGLRHAASTEVTLQRPTTGGRFLVYDSAFPSVGRQTGVVLGEQHSPKHPDTISGFLLGLCGLWGKIILETLAGKTRSISFRNLAPYFIVRENSIIRLSTPISALSTSMLSRSS